MFGEWEYVRNNSSWSTVLQKVHRGSRAQLGQRIEVLRPLDTIQGPLFIYFFSFYFNGIEHGQELP